MAEVRAAYGKCVCALCGIDETTRYPAALAARIFEVHHLAPLAKAATPVRTTLADLSVLCANCHRAVHATLAVEKNYSSLATHLRSELK
jgi:predicted HNH restriction endonuclease